MILGDFCKVGLLTFLPGILTIGNAATLGAAGLLATNVPMTIDVFTRVMFFFGQSYAFYISELCFLTRVMFFHCSQGVGGWLVK